MTAKDAEKYDELRVAVVDLEGEPWEDCIEDDGGCFNHFDDNWPCRGERLRRLMESLDS